MIDESDNQLLDKLSVALVFSHLKPFGHVLKQSLIPRCFFHDSKHIGLREPVRWQHVEVPAHYANY